MLGCGMPRPAQPVALGFTAFRLWRRLPPAQRRMLLEVARTHGPRIAAGAVAAASSRRADEPLTRQRLRAQPADAERLRTMRSCSRWCAVG